MSKRNVRKQPSQRQPHDVGPLGMPNVHILNQPKPNVIEDRDKQIPIPARGLAVIRLVAIEKTGGGIILPGTTAPNGEPAPKVAWAILVDIGEGVAISEPMGVERKVDYPIGARLFMKEGCFVGEHFSFPSDIRLVKLDHVIGHAVPPKDAPQAEGRLVEAPVGSA